MFNEITKKGVLAALEHPTTINKQMVDAQQARRVLDRLVGYKISPLLWDKVRRGLSAGRVQSVALKLVVRPRARDRAFVARGVLEHHGAARRTGAAGVRRAARSSATARTSRSANEAEADADRSPISKAATWIVASVTTKERKKGAVPPFITSKLQQASRFPVKKTMMIAQQLYEGIELPGEGAVGLITYMRTDSTRVSDQALDRRARVHRPSSSARTTCRRSRTSIKTKSDAQDAHEAIRPTSMQYHPDDGPRRTSRRISTTSTS